MPSIDWDNDVQEFERYEKLSLKVGEEIEGVARDNGNIVTKKTLEEAGAKYPRDSCVFVIDVEEPEKHKGLKEFWIGRKNFSLLAQFKKIRERQSGTLVGTRLRIKRISDKLSETNYQITNITEDVVK